MHHALTIGLTALLLSACGGAETAAPTSTSTSSKVIALRGARVIDGNGGAPLENSVVLIEGTMIKAVGAAAAVTVPKGARVVELAGLTIVPGLVTDHSHVGMVDGVEGGEGHYTRANVLRQLSQYEAYGVTTVTSLGMNGPVFYELQPALHRGELPGADLFGADRGIGVPANAPPMDVGPDRLFRPVTVDQARLAVRDTASRHPSFVKIWVDDFNGSLEKKMEPEMYAAIIDEAHRANLRVAAHVYYLEDAKRLVAAGVDVLAHGIRDRPVDAELIDALKQHHTGYIATLGLDEAFYVFAEAPPWTKSPFFRHALQPALAAQLDDPAWRQQALGDPAKLAVQKGAVAMNEQNLKALQAAGVAIGFGTDSGATPLRIPGFAEHRELKLMTDAGLTPLQAITLATRDAAALLRVTDRGVIAPGKLADLLVVEGNPAVGIEAIDRIRGGSMRDSPIESR